MHYFVYLSTDFFLTSNYLLIMDIQRKTNYYLVRKEKIMSFIHYCKDIQCLGWKRVHSS